MTLPRARITPGERFVVHGYGASFQVDSNSAERATPARGLHF
jgi:hypothetical protein